MKGAMTTVILISVGIILFGAVSQIGLNILEKTADKTQLQASTPATGTLTFADNVTNGELFNISDSGGRKYVFEFNTTGISSTSPWKCSAYTDCILVNISTALGEKNSIKASGNLTAKINANASTVALVTAVNTTNLTTITYNTNGVRGNAMTLADNSANATSSGMSGGLDADTFRAASDDNVDAVETGFDFQEILILAIVGAFIFGLFLRFVRF